MLLQTNLTHFRGTDLNVLGTMYHVDANLCVELPDDTDEALVARFGTMGFIPTEKAEAARKASARAGRAKASLRKGYEATLEFLRHVMATPALRDQAAKMRKFAEFEQLAAASGYAITREHYDRAQRALAADPAPSAEREELSDEVCTPFGTYSASDLADIAKELGLSEREVFCKAFHLTDGGQDAADVLSRADLMMLVGPAAEEPPAPPAGDDGDKKPAAKKKTAKKKAAKKKAD